MIPPRDLDALPRDARPRLSELREELRATPGRMATSLRAGVAAPVAFGLAVLLGVENPGIVVQVAVLGLMPGRHPTLHRVPASLAIVCVIAGVLVFAAPFSDMPWLLVPVFAALVALLFTATRVWPAYYPAQYAAIIGTKDAVMSACLLPASATAAAVSMIVGFFVSILVGTAAGKLIFPQDPRLPLSAALAADLRRRRRELDAIAAALFENERPEAITSMHGAPAIAQNLKALNPGQTATPRQAAERARRLAMITTAARVSALVKRLSQSIHRKTPSNVMLSLEPALRPALAAISTCIESYAKFTEKHLHLADTGASRELPWPDLPGEMDAVERRFRDMTEKADFQLEGSYLPAILSVLRELADALRLPPEAWVREPLSRFAARPEPFSLGSLWPSLRCWKASLAATLALTVVLVSQNKEMITAPWTAVMLQENTHGGSVRKALLRAVGALLGAALSFLCILWVWPNTSDLTVCLLVTGGVAFASTYGAHASSKYAYALGQAGTTFFLCGLSSSPNLPVDVGLSRVLGVFWGIAAVFVVFQLFTNERAGTLALKEMSQLLSPLSPMLRAREPVPVSSLIECDRRRIGHVQRTFALFDEAAFEHGTSGIDLREAPSTLSLARRVGLHVTALRSTAPDPLPASLSRALEDTSEALAQWVDVVALTLDVPAVPNRWFGRARAPVSDRSLPALKGRVESLFRAIEEAKRGGTLDTQAYMGVSAQAAHMQRLSEALPQLLSSAQATFLAPTRTQALAVTASSAE